MSRFGFCGPSYPSLSPNVDAERCINFYPETVEGQGASSVAMYPTPGLNLFATLAGAGVNGLYQYNGRLFGVGSNFAEINSAGVVTAYTFLPTVTAPATMVANNNGQLAVCAQNQLWLFPDRKAHV